MYADRVETGAKGSIQDRLNGGTLNNPGRRRQVTGKRQRQDDDKWEHDLYDHADPQISNRRIGSKDLRLKLQKKSIQQANISSKGSLPTGVRDLREKLSGVTYPEPMETAPAKPKQAKPLLESSKPSKKSIAVEDPVPVTKKVSSSVSKKKTQQKADSVDTFLLTLGLEKYSITFQAEEIDMAALLHMTDDDLKAIGIPMGPRKKILLALGSKV